MSERVVTAAELAVRARLERALAPDVVRALEELIAETVRAEFAEGGHGGDGSPWLSIREGAGYLGVSERKLQRLIARDRVRSTTIGRRRLLHRDDLDAFATTGEETAPTAPPRRRKGVE